MPEQQDGLMEGFQLWLNLPARDKMNPPWYRDFKADEIPSFVTDGGVSVRVIAGASHGVTGAVTREVTEPLYLDVHLPAGARFTQTLAPQAHAFVYVYRGELTIAGAGVPERNMAVLADGGDGVVLEAGVSPARVLLVAGLPLDEPIVQHGPFVMNTEAEIYAAVSDYKEGRLGQGG
jgi:redox-sensitive bicupin YhaK (pirin superfamily)